MTHKLPVALAVFAFLMPVAEVRADVGVPGFRRVDTLLSFDNLGDFPEHVFFLVVPNWLEGKDTPGSRKPSAPQRVTPDSFHAPNSNALRWNREWVLVAVPRRQGEESRADVGWDALSAGNTGVLHSNKLALSRAGDVFLLYPQSYELHHFRVALESGKLTVTPGSVESVSFDVGSVRVPTWAVGVALTMVAIGLGFWFIRWRRRRAALAAR
jgi:hypothetical protein